MASGLVVRDATHSLGKRCPSSPSELRAQELQELFQLHEDYLDLTRRIDGIDRDATLFTQRLETISGQLGVVFANQSVEQTIRQLRAGHEQAVAAEEKRKTLVEQRETLLAGRQTIIDQRRTTSAQLDELCKLALCDDPHLLPAIVVEAEGRRLKEKEVSELENSLLHSRGINPSTNSF